jgi:hypothetical protein
MTRDELCGRFIESVPYSLYAVQEESLLAWFESDGGILLCARTGLGLMLLLFWGLSCSGTMLTVVDQRIILRNGLLSQFVNEIMSADVRNIQISQTFLPRLLGVGKIGISTAAQSGIEIEVAGIPCPDQVRELIDTRG